MKETVTIPTQDLINYIYEFAWHYGRLYHIGDADKIVESIKEKFQIPEEYVQAYNKTIY